MFIGTLGLEDGSMMIHAINLSLLMFFMISVCALRSGRVSGLVPRTLCGLIIYYVINDECLASWPRVT